MGNSSQQDLKHLSLAKYKFIIQAREKLILPFFKGFTLRGGFGSVFHKIVCVNKQTDCSHCLLKDKCIYPYIFETFPPKNVYHLSKYRSIPRPFIIEPPLEKKREYSPGEIFSFNLILIGRAIEYLPYFIFTFSRLGDVGLGREKARYKLIRVESSNNFQKKEIIYDGEHQTLKNVNIQIDISSIFSSLVVRNQPILIKFITPMRIKYQGSYTSYPHFHILLRSLLRRLSSLLYFHCGKELNINYKEVIRESEEIKVSDVSVEWVDWERYSNRQEQRMKLGGFIGSALYKGDIGKFLPFLKIGEYTHLGKAAVFGLGKYELYI